MTPTSEFFSTNQTASVSQNQTKDDRIIVIVTRTFEAYFRNKKTSNVSASFTSNANSNNNNSASTDDARISIRKWTCENIEFFDLSIENIALVVNVEKHVFYRNIYAFIDRLKDMIVHRKLDKLRNVISQCLREFVLIWHSTKLSDLKKNMLREAFLQMWYNALIKRFKQRTSAILISIQASRYTMKDARRQKNSRIFAQNLFRHAKAVDLISMHNQISMTWNNLNWQFRRNISKSTDSTIIRHFLNQFDNYSNIWFEMTNSQSQTQYEARKFFTKHHQNNDRNRIFISSFYFDRISQKDNAYQRDNQNRQFRQNERPRLKITIKVEDKLRTKEREFDRERNVMNKNKESNRNRERNKARKRYRYESRSDSYKDKDKVKAFFSNEKIEVSDDESSMKDYHQSKDLNYFNSDQNSHSDIENAYVNISMSLIIACRACKLFFFSNNALHNHLRQNCVRKNKIESFHDSSLTKSDCFVHSETMTATLSILKFDVNSNQDIDIDYDFKNWQYVITEICLTENALSISECIDSDVEIILIDTDFFKSQTRNHVAIRKMTISITVRDLNANKHMTNRYAIISIYFKKKNQHNNEIRVMIIREIHLIDELKVNILLENDILDSELFDIFMSTSTVYIESCKVTILIRIINIHRSFQSMSVHFTKVKIVSSNFKCLVSIHRISASIREYLFEPSDSTNFSIYAHLMNDEINFVLIRNNSNKSLKILRNFRLNTLIQSAYINAFQVENMSNMTLRNSKSEHKTSWFKKVFAAATAYVANINEHVFDSKEVTLINEITIHDFFRQTINVFINLLNEYVNIWIDQDFVKLSEKNWMKLFLKSDWENKIKEKAKVYSLDSRDRKIIDSIFDELQRQNKLSYITKSTLFSFSCFVVWRESFDKRKNRVVIDIRDLNAISQLDAYSISLQFDVLQAVQNCIYISVIDCFEFFYQWRIHSSNRHKFIVITHREQETFNVAVMRYRNSSFYVQKQINRVLRFYNYVKTYIDDIIIYSKSLEKHFAHFREIFNVLKINNISINSKKVYIEYSSINLLNQHVNFFDFAIDEQKLKAIAQFVFLKTLEQLETYLDLIDWFRNYIEAYAAKSKFL